MTRAVHRWGEANAAQVSVHVEGEARTTGHDETLLRAMQEALANAARHSGATRVAVTLTYDDRETRLDVRDDGRGFDPDRVSPGAGLTGLRQRVAETGGSLEIETGSGEGCTVSVAVPA